ncbi:MAG: PIG-L family deacetylase [Deltaproteobacteria bacterium]
MKRLLPLLFTACVTVPEPAVPPTIDDVFAAEDARVMWVAAHPDDEMLGGPVLARACIGHKTPCLFAVMNAGDGGECLRPEGCEPSVGAVRSVELTHVAHAMGAKLVHWRYYNAPLPVSSFPTRQELAEKWIADGHPGERLEKLIREFKPTVVITFDPHNGFTGHPEHQLASRFATQAVRRASKGPDAHRVPYVYHLLNKYWFFRVAGGGDDPAPTEIFTSDKPCGPPGRWCLDVALEISKAHRSQSADMGAVRSLRPQFGIHYLRRIDPFDLELAPEPTQ